MIFEMIEELKQKFTSEELACLDFDKIENLLKAFEKIEHSHNLYGAMYWINSICLKDLLLIIFKILEERKDPDVDYYRSHQCRH
jgi:hypothetical protein